MSALAAYESGLRIGGGCWVNSHDGDRVELPLQRWLDPADRCDRLLLERCGGATLDVGCGPGRLTVELMDRGVDALGIDISGEAIRIARARGAHALQRDVFGRLPGVGDWQHVLLADGNIGIGGSPIKLLRRVSEIVKPGGSIVVEVEAPGRGFRQRMLRLEGHGHLGWIPWAHVSVDAADHIAVMAGLTVRDVIVTAAKRYFVELKHAASSVACGHG